MRIRNVIKGNLSNPHLSKRKYDVTIKTGSAIIVDTHFRAADLYSGPEGSILGLAPSIVVVEAAVAVVRGVAGLDLNSVALVFVAAGLAGWLVTSAVAGSGRWSGAAAAASGEITAFLGFVVAALSGLAVFSFLASFLVDRAVFVVDACRMPWQRGVVILTGAAPVAILVQVLPHLDSNCALFPSRAILSILCVSVGVDQEIRRLTMIYHCSGLRGLSSTKTKPAVGFRRCAEG